MADQVEEVAPSTVPASPVMALRERIDTWRRERLRPRSRLPEELWLEAAALARVHGLNLVARAVKLDYYSLKERMGSASERTEGKRHPTFVEVAVTPPTATIGDCVVEFVRPDGSRMTIRTNSKADLVALGELFWRQRA